MAQRTIVVAVDDNADILKSVARLLARHGIDSRTFASAEALLESDSVQTPTCLLLDIHPGEISGIELQRWTLGASPICAIHSKGMSCWIPFGKLWLSRRGCNKNTRGHHICSGSTASVWRCPGEVCFSPDSDRIAEIAACLLAQRPRHIHSCTDNGLGFYYARLVISSRP